MSVDFPSVVRQAHPDYPGVVCEAGSYRVVVGRGSATPDDFGGFYFRLQVWMPLGGVRKGKPWPCGWSAVPSSSSSSLAEFRLKVAGLPDVIAALLGCPADPREAAPALVAALAQQDAALSAF